MILSSSSFKIVPGVTVSVDLQVVLQVSVEELRTPRAGYLPAESFIKYIATSSEAMPKA